MDDRQFDMILDRFGRSPRGYRRVRKGVKKRLVRHMQRIGCATVTGYLKFLEDNPDALTECERLLTVSISRFFRDGQVWDVLGEIIIPRLIETDPDKIHVWSAGCALGQEVYSFKIMWSEAPQAATRPRLFVTATDGNPSYLQRAKRGMYDAPMLKAAACHIRNRYFHPTDDGTHYEIDRSLKKDILWELHDLVRQPPPEKRFSLIFLRNNLLTYYRREVRESALRPILDRLAAGGFLIIGSHECLPSHAGKLAPFEGCSCIFQKS
jgi:chemotaxis protein methyltransferase CheR